MRIKIQQFLFGKSHSWSIVSQNLGRSFLKKGHDVEFISTDGFIEKYCPQDLREHVREKASGKYDMQLSYTQPHQWVNNLSEKFGGKKFSIWNYEYNIKKKTSFMPGFAKYDRYVEAFLPSSNFSREVFLSMGMRDEKMHVIPHGINLEDFSSDEKIQIPTSKKYKILLNVAQPHRRKAIPLALESFGKAFSKSDDVALVAKVLIGNKNKEKVQSFDVDFLPMLETFKKNYPNHAEILLMTEYIPSISSLYKACDVNFSATHAECWHLPSLEAMACGLINIVPNYGGQLHFCHENNGLLIDGKIVRAPKFHQYYHPSEFGVHFKIDTDDAAEKLRMAVDSHDELKKKFEPEMKKTAKIFTWDNAAEQILQLV